ncbi:MAG: class I SAM-dependent RNA methyltransferase [Rubrimonas sp.]
MTDAAALDIFLAAAPGLEETLRAEAAEAGFANPRTAPGGVLVEGDWPEVWRANLVLRGAGRVLVRVAAFHAVHLAQLDKRARRVDWPRLLPPGAVVRVDATCQKSRIYHAGAAAQRIGRALAEATGATLAPASTEGAIRVLTRIVDDLCVISLDASGEPLHRRGHKLAVGKAPLRETLAALFLRQCGFTGAEPVLDPMCGSGTFVLEAAEIARGLHPGRDRSFAFQTLAGFDPDAWDRLRLTSARPSPAWFFGYDRDAGAVEMARANAQRAGVDQIATFGQQPVSAFAPPRGLPAGLVMVNPPYGERIGEKDDLRPLYGTLGRVLRERFAGWRVGLVTSEPALAQATGLPFQPPGPPIPHGPLKIRLFRTGPLPA